jgi:hypothetical protein
MKFSSLNGIRSDFLVLKLKNEKILKKREKTEKILLTKQEKYCRIKKMKNKLII